MEKRLENLLSALVACNSINPTLAGGPGEVEVVALVAHLLGGFGLTPEVQEVAPGRPNVVARVPGRGETPPLLLNAHLDTVGVEDMDQPFTLRREDDQLYGRGAYDMKGSAALMLALAERFAVAPPPGDLLLTFVADEEDRSLGTEHLVREWLPTLPHLPTAAFVLEPTEEQIGLAHKGFAWFEIDVAGRAAHGSRADEGIDAVLPLGAGLQALAALEIGLANSPPHPRLGHGSLHASHVAGGSAWSVYPAEARLSWERRTLPGEGEFVLESELERVLEAVRGAPGRHRAEGRIVFTRQPHEVDDGSLPVRLLQQAAPEAATVGVAFWADSALLGAAGIPTVLYGPSGHGAHAIDEWVSLESLCRVYAVLENVIAGM